MPFIILVMILGKGHDRCSSASRPVLQPKIGLGMSLAIGTATTLDCVDVCVYIQMIKTEQRQFEQWVVTGEGSEVMKSGSHEARVYKAVDENAGTAQSEIMV